MLERMNKRLTAVQTRVLCISQQACLVRICEASGSEASRYGAGNMVQCMQQGKGDSSCGGQEGFFLTGEEMIPVAANNVAFSIHAVLLTAFTLFQISIYDRGSRKVLRISIGIVFAVWLSVAVSFFIALDSHSWLWLISVFNTIQVLMTVIKYIPQSTDGFSIGNILLDFCGGVTNYGQMASRSIDQGSWVNFYGNMGKLLLSLMIPVAANDVAFSIHAVLLTTFTLFQISIYDCGSRKVPRISIAIVSAVWLSAAVCFFIALHSHTWLWLISVFKHISILCERALMAGQSIDQGSWVNFYTVTWGSYCYLWYPSSSISSSFANILLYPSKKAASSSKVMKRNNAEPFIKSPELPESENV